MSRSSPETTPDRAKILVVEDEVIVAMDIQSSLISFGYDVPRTTDNGEDALILAKQLHPDLVLMDINLKGDMDGIETAEKILTDLGIPSIYLTAYADRNTLDRAKSTAPFGYIVKPFEETNLYTTIEVALSKHREQQLLHRTIADALIDLPNRQTFIEQVKRTLAKAKQENQTAFSSAIESYLKQYNLEENIASSENNKLSAAELANILEYISDRLEETIPLEDLAARLGISKHHFCRIFKQSIGTPPHQYLIQQRIEKAKQLLEQGNDAIADIAYQCGFKSQSHLNRHFKQQTGITPRQYQKLRSKPNYLEL